MRLLLATDAWTPQVNGVVRTWSNVIAELEREGDSVEVLSTARFAAEGAPTFPLPTYPEIGLALPGRRRVREAIDAIRPDAIHIATEGPIGTAVRRHCLRAGLAFTTSYHTRLPEFIAARVPLPGLEGALYRWLRGFHRPARAVLAPTQAITDDLRARGFGNVVTWTRGVDHATFHADVAPHDYGHRSGPVLICCGRVAVEKGVERFLEAAVPGHPDPLRVVIGDGPARPALERRYPDALFTGYRFGDELARHLRGGDALVFPSRVDTFGLVMVEAMACGLPVAAHRVPGPIDVVDERSGALREDLGEAIAAALRLDPKGAVARARHFTWAETARRLRAALVPLQA